MWGCDRKICPLWSLFFITRQASWCQSVILGPTLTLMIDSCITCHVLAQIFSSCIFVYLYRNNRKVGLPNWGFCWHVPYRALCNIFMHMPGILWGLMSGLKIRVCFLFYQPKQMLWVLKRTVSMRRYWEGSFEHPKYMYKLMGKK